MEKYLFLYLNTGGGHYAPAKAISETIKKHRGTDIEIILHEGLTGTRPFMRKIIEDGYKYSVNKALWSFELLYAINKIKLISVLTLDFATYFIKPAIRDFLLKEQPDKIIIYHYMLISSVNEILREDNLSIPVIVVVTDPFTAPSVWFHEGNLNFIVFSDTLRDHCIKMGIDRNKIQVFPFVLDQKFSSPANNNQKLKLRKEYGFREDSRIILIIGGGDGMPGGGKIFRSIVSSGIDAEIAVVCGRDKNLIKQLTERKERHKLENTRIYGFIDFTHSLMQISDVVITKAGPSVCMEILLSGTVPVINNYIWEQEKGNMEFICNGGMGIYKRNPRKIPDVIKRLFNDSEYYNDITSNIRKNQIRNGVDQVSKYIMNFN